MANSTDLRARLLKAMEESDNLRREDRVNRALWFAEHPAYGMIVGPMDTMQVFAEAKQCFVDGHYVATLLLALAFIEHVLMDALTARQLDGKGGTFAVAIKRARVHKLFPDKLLSRVDALREIRNPFAHRRPPYHKHRFDNRFKDRGEHPDAILEEDAKEALNVMYAFLRRILVPGSDEAIERASTRFDEALKRLADK